MNNAAIFDYDLLVLLAGKHEAGNGVCLLEAVAWVAGEPHSDHPVCVSPVLAAFGRSWNDQMRTDAKRDSLKQYIPLLIGTAGDKATDERRAWLLIDWFIRAQTPVWLRLAGLTEHADALAALQPITNAECAASVEGTINAARASARDATRDATGDAAEAATLAAAVTATWAAAMVASWSATWVAAEVAAKDAAWAGVGDIQPIINALENSKHDLYRRMIAAEEAPARWPMLVMTEEGT